MTDENQPNDITEKPVALITGAARGIGRAVCMELASKGYDVAGVDIAWIADAEAPSARNLASVMARGGSTFLPLGYDIADLCCHAGLLEAVLSRLKKIDLLVNNAGIAPLQRADLLDMSPESYDRVLATNLRGPFFLTQRIAGWMAGAKKAHPDRQPCIVFITSISSVTSSTNRGEYCISKAGLSMAATLYADRLGALDIPVFEVRPGIITTDMTAPVKEKYDDLIREGMVPQRRWGTPEDVARVVAMLAGGAFGYSTGTAIDVSGGMNIRRL
jgi:3-oxoacyl-[acyl-carrier protein] reductase